jgi:isoquinoline 1-oxidoreductase alpha subunit
LIKFRLNDKDVSFEGDNDTPLLWVIRDHLMMTGTKYGCGIGLCGACTVHIDGEATRSCVITVAEVAARSVTTIEGLADGDELHPVQQAWMDIDVPQCGFCQPGMIMEVADFLEHHPNPSDDDIDDGVTNICRCGTYPRVRKAIHHAASIREADE